MKKQIKIKLQPDGQIQVETIGIKGTECIEYMKMAARLANAEIVKTEYTKDYYSLQEQNEYNQQSF